MDTAALSRRVYAVIVVAALLIGGVVVFEVINARTVDRARTSVQNSLDVERNLAELGRLRIVASLMHRSYLQSGEEWRLTTGNQAYGDGLTIIDSLYSLVEAPAVRLDLDSIRQVIYFVQEGVNEGIVAFHAGHDSLALALYSSLTVSEPVDVYVRSFNRLRNRYVVALAENNEYVGKSLRTARGIRIVGLMILSLVVGYLFYCIRHLISSQERLIRDLSTENTRRRATEVQLEALINDLELKNESLDNFAYIASHDLQEPLRTVSNFATAIEEDFGSKIGEEGKPYLRFITEATTRMQQLITGLLHFSQLGRSAAPETVDLNVKLAAILADLDAVIRDKQAVVTHDVLPTVTGYRTELRQLLQNLLANALKFTRPGEAPRVNITVAETETAYAISVTDQGIGISPEGQAAMFRMFARLNAAKDYEGQGIGLTYCRKIVELHGGQLTVDSEPGRGSTFTFTLPKHSSLEQKATPGPAGG